MKRSLNEISGMVVKAARGAGVPLGHCEDIGHAAAYLAATDPARLACVLDALDRPHEPATISDDKIPDARAAMAGPIAVDAIAAGHETIQFVQLDAPRLVLALFAVRGVSITHQTSGTTLIVSRSDKPRVPSPMAAAVTVSALLWDQLGALAAKTYVPTSDASRLAGAGAGLNDND